MQLVKYEAVKSQLAECVEVDEVKDIRDKSIAVAAYAKQAGDKSLELDARALRLRSERRLGELIKAMPKPTNRHRKPSGVNPTPLEVPTLGEVGIDKNLAKAARLASRIPAKEFDEFIEQHRSLGQVPTLSKLRNGSHVSHNNRDNNEWYTPSKYIDAARDVMGGIDVDPCSSAKAQKVVKAKRYYTVADDGLTMEWRGRIWMNPPYGTSIVSEFCRALVEELDSGRTEQACVLVNNATETDWCQLLLSRANAICFIRGRVKFLDSTGREANSPLQGQLLLYFGPHWKTVPKKWGHIGFVVAVSRKQTKVGRAGL